MSQTKATAAGGASDPVTAVANVVGIVLEMISSANATKYSRRLAEIRKERSAEQAKYPAWDASRIKDLYDEEDAIMVAVEMELIRAKRS